MESAMPQHLSQAVVRQLLRYDPASGSLMWKRRSRKWFRTRRAWQAWNSKNANRPAFTATNSMGRHQGTILGQYFLSYRVAYLLMVGRWPRQIDHLNHDR